jgi:hypothetical protein
MSMGALVRSWFVCVGVVCTSVALAAPKVDPQERHKVAEQQYKSGEYEKALATIAEGLASAPKDGPLLRLKGTVLLRMDDPEALGAYQAFLAAGATGSEKVAAMKIVDILTQRRTTFLEITVANGPADVYVGLGKRRVFCRAEPACKGAVSPGPHKVTVVRKGFQRWTDRPTVAGGATAKLAVTLIEDPSKLAVRVTPPGASITIDGAAYDAPTTVAAGEHQVVASLEGHETARRQAVASMGNAIDLEITLARIVPASISPPSAELVLDGKPVSIQAGGIAIPPGAHGLEVRAPGHRGRKVSIPAERGPEYQIAVELSLIEQTVAKPGWLTGRRTLGLAAGGLSLAAVGTGVVLGRQARQLETNALTLCPAPSNPCFYAPQANDFNRRGRARALQTNIAFGVAGGATIAAGILWFTGARESRVAVTPHLGAVAGLDLAVRF